MKQRWLIVALTLALLLSLALAACGEKKTEEDADAGSAPASAVVSSADAASNAAAPSAAPSTDSKQKDDQNQSAESRQDSAAQGQQEDENDASSGDAPSPTYAGNPAYQDGEKPVYTISLTEKTTKQTYSAACNYADDNEDFAFVNFYLPGGEYEIAVYEYSDTGEKTDPIATGGLKNKIAADKRNTIQVSYTPSTGRVMAQTVISKRTH